MAKPKKPIQFYPEVSAQMEAVVAAGLETYLQEFTSAIFADYTRPETQDTIMRGIARGLHDYEKRTGVPIIQTLALNLLDLKETK